MMNKDTNMNEMMVVGLFYLDTMATTNEEAYKDFVHRCREIGMNCDNIQSIVIRNSEGENITQMRQYL